MSACTSVASHVRLYFCSQPCPLVLVSLHATLNYVQFISNKQPGSQTQSSSLRSPQSVALVHQMQKANTSAVVKEQAVRILRDAACAPPRLSTSIRAFYHNQCALKIVKFSIELDACSYFKERFVKKVKNFKELWKFDEAVKYTWSTKMSF